MSSEIKRMFSKIAKNYDKANRLISMGADVRWRRTTALMCLSKGNDLKILDVATGTGDLALSIAAEAKSWEKRIKIKGLDFNKEMLDIAREKIAKKGYGNIELIEGDALYTHLDAASFDVITCGFALRNFDDLLKFLKEMYRILKPGGRIVFLDAARPDSALESFMKLYYFRVIPALGSMYNKDAYIYFATSVWKFDKKKLVQHAKSAGFRNVKLTNLAFNSVYVLTATKPKKKR